jgi:hypothetical protein
MILKPCDVGLNEAGVGLSESCFCCPRISGHKLSPPSATLWVAQHPGATLMTTEQNSAAFRPPPPPADTYSPAGRASTPPSLVTFTLLQGGPTSADYELFTSSRRCLEEAIGDAMEYDDVAFHEGNVPLSVQLSLHLKMYTTPPRMCCPLEPPLSPFPLSLLGTPRRLRQPFRSSSTRVGVAAFCTQAPPAVCGRARARRLR